ncbi:MAG: amino acid permease [Phycisphaerales bacterium]|nr:amino acid permease [Phycisphaerales bacterium]
MASTAAPPFQPPASQPARSLNALDATCVVIGGIVGVGIFFNPSSVAAIVHSDQLAMLAWAIGGLIALCGAFTFAELGARYFNSGAQYEVLRDAYGPMPAFLFVFCNATAIQAGAIGIIAIVCVHNLAVVARFDAGPTTTAALAAAIILTIALANVLGTRSGATIQNLTVYAKIAALAAITAIAAFFAPDTVPPLSAATAASADAAARTLSPVSAVLAALVPVLFAYGGWQQALWISGEVRNPRRNLPLAITVGVAIVVTVYLLANWAYLRLLGVEDVAGSKALAADAVGVAFPGAGSRVIAGVVAVSAFGVLNSQLLTGPRLIYAMALDGRFFEWFGRLDPRRGTPARAIMLLATMSLVLLITARQNGLERLLTGVVFIDGVFFVATGAALLVLRERRRAKAREALTSGIATSAEPPTFRAPGYPIVPLLFVIGELGVVVGAYLNPAVREAALIGIAWIFAAAVLYWVRFRRP